MPPHKVFGTFELDPRLGDQMSISVLHERVGGGLPLPDNREQLVQILGHAFPLGDGGSFTDVLETVRATTDETPCAPIMAAQPA